MLVIIISLFTEIFLICLAAKAVTTFGAESCENWFLNVVKPFSSLAKQKVSPPRPNEI